MKSFLKMLVLPVAGVAMAMCVSGAGADPIQANIGDVLNPVKTVGLGAGQNVSVINQLGGSESGFAGQINWTGTNQTTSKPEGSFFTYCVQLTTNVFVPSGNLSYTVTALANTPDVSLAADAANRAKDISNMINVNGGASFFATTNNVQAAALQVAIWDLVYNGEQNVDATTGFDITSASGHTAAGDKFRLTSGDPVATQAKAYLDSILAGAAGSRHIDRTLDGFGAQVVGMKSNDLPPDQNQAITIFADSAATVPLPRIPAAFALLLGVGCCFGKVYGAKRLQA